MSSCVLGPPIDGLYRETKFYFGPQWAAPARPPSTWPRNNATQAAAQTAQAISNQSRAGAVSSRPSADLLSSAPRSAPPLALASKSGRAPTLRWLSLLGQSSYFCASLVSASNQTRARKFVSCQRRRRVSAPASGAHKRTRRLLLLLICKFAPSRTTCCWAHWRFA